ncbi:hypothetical protein [Flavobacterium sp. MK4S-17]|uniref:hypothetical protein n=1 Tax=Flavobacterium sp. MK4S-17 TaxID=2543737 RepID=UPI00135B90DF|nr:hypothetical protein [Flavobacterium sp. MK4S-17]
MKKSFLYIAVALFALAFSIPAVAQVSRSIGREQYKRSKSKNEKVDFVEQTVLYLKKELTLDDFQFAAVREIIEEQRSAFTALGEAKDMHPNEKRDKAREIYDKIDQRILPILSRQQTEKYLEMKEKRKL